MAIRPARIGPHRDRPHYVIAQLYARHPPQLFEVTSQNHRTRRLWARDMAGDTKTWISMDDVLATHQDEADARACFAEVLRALPDLLRSADRARRDWIDALTRMDVQVKRLATGQAHAGA